MRSNTSSAINDLATQLSKITSDLSVIDIEDPDVVGLKAQGALLAQMLARAEATQVPLNQDQLDELSSLIGEFGSIAAEAISDLTPVKQ